MDKLLLIATAVIAWFVLGYVYWWVLERVHPLVYRDVPSADLAEHFWELYVRADTGTMMVVTDQQSGKSIRLRKHYSLKEPDIHLDLILDDLTRKTPEAARVVFREVYALPEDSLCAVHVRGWIGPDDKVRDGHIKWGDPLKWGSPAKPYKRWQVPGGMFYWVGRATGAIARAVRDFFFPPRGPGGDLKP